MPITSANVSITLELLHRRSGRMSRLSPGVHIDQVQHPHRPPIHSSTMPDALHFRNRFAAIAN